MRGVVLVTLALLASTSAAGAQGVFMGPTRIVAEVADEYVLVLGGVAQPTSIAPQHFATEADCDALAKQMPGKARCLKARIIKQPVTPQ